MVRVESLSLAPGSVEGEHQLSARALSQWMLSDECLQLGDERRVSSGLEICVDPLLEAGESELVEPCDFGLGKGLVREVGQRSSAPEPKSLRELPVLDKLCELLQIELSGLDSKLITESARGNAVAAKALAKLRDVDLQRLGRRPWGSLAPQRLDQPVARDDAIRVEQENGKQGAVFRGADVDRATFVENLQRTQDSKLHAPGG